MEVPLHWRHEWKGSNFPRPPLVSSNTPSRATTFCSSKNHTSFPRSQHTPRNMGRTTTMRRHLFPYEWKRWCMTSQSGEAPLHRISAKGYVLGTDFEHYRAWKMWMKDTRVTRISATVFHKHKDITNPSVTPEDHVMATSSKLAADLKGRMATHLSKTALHQLE